MSSIELRGKSFDIVPLTDWTIGDSRWAAQVLGRAIGDLDDDDAEQAIAVIMVTVRHGEPDWSPKQVAEFVDSFTIGELQKAFKAVKRDDADPPEGAASPPPSSSDESTSSPADSPEAHV